MPNIKVPFLPRPAGIPLSSLLGRGLAGMEQNHIKDEHQLFAGFKTAFKSFATEAIHVGQEPEQWTSMAVVPPISLSTTFKQEEPGKHAVSSPVICGYQRLEMTRIRTHVLVWVTRKYYRWASTNAGTMLIGDTDRRKIHPFAAACS